MVSSLTIAATLGTVAATPYTTERGVGVGTPPGRTGAPPGDYETYVLALEWQPSWSLDACPGHSGANPGLIQHMAGAAALNQLSLHGLWPNYDSAKHQGYDWPQFCAVSGAYNCQSQPPQPQCRPQALALLPCVTRSGAVLVVLTARHLLYSETSCCLYP